MPSITVYYHSNCPNGFTAAWVMWTFYRDQANYVPCAYGAPLKEPAHSTGTVFFVDFCPPRDVLESLAKTFTLYVFDHHKTAKADLEGFTPQFGKVVFDMERSGAGITYDEMFPVPMFVRPALVNYVEDRDLWRFKLPKSKEMNALILSYSYQFDVWSKINDEFESEFSGNLAERGADILRARQQSVRQMTRHYRWGWIGGHYFPYVNATDVFSEVAEELAIKTEVGIGAYYADRADGKRQWGLRSRGDIDVSAVAKQLGGGGHKGAAGFVTEQDWLPPVNTIHHANSV